MSTYDIACFGGWVLGVDSGLCATMSASFSGLSRYHIYFLVRPLTHHVYFHLRDLTHLLRASSHHGYSTMDMVCLACWRGHPTTSQTYQTGSVHMSWFLLHDDLCLVHWHTMSLKLNHIFLVHAILKRVRKRCFLPMFYMAIVPYSHLKHFFYPLKILV